MPTLQLGVSSCQTPARWQVKRGTPAKRTTDPEMAGRNLKVALAKLKDRPPQWRIGLDGERDQLACHASRRN